jgi:hypothetical protein
MQTGCKAHPVHTRPLRAKRALPRHQTDHVLLGVKRLAGSFLLALTDDRAEPRLSQSVSFAKRSRRQKQKWKAQLISCDPINSRSSRAASASLRRRLHGTRAHRRGPRSEQRPIFLGRGRRPRGGVVCGCSLCPSS